jgi:hypothetical protein
MQKRNPLYYKLSEAWYLLSEGGTIMPKHAAEK